MRPNDEVVKGVSEDVDEEFAVSGDLVGVSVLASFKTRRCLVRRREDVGLFWLGRLCPRENRDALLEVANGTTNITTTSICSIWEADEVRKNPAAIFPNSQWSVSVSSLLGLDQDVLIPRFRLRLGLV